MMKLECLEDSNRPAFLPGVSFGLRDTSQGGART
jgi:hypothetical protein